MEDGCAARVAQTSRLSKWRAALKATEDEETDSDLECAVRLMDRGHRISAVRIWLSEVRAEMVKVRAKATLVPSAALSMDPVLRRLSHVPSKAPHLLRRNP
jgi:hypothetical protein